MGNKRKRLGRGRGKVVRDGERESTGPVGPTTDWTVQLQEATASALCILSSHNWSDLFIYFLYYQPPHTRGMPIS